MLIGWTIRIALPALAVAAMLASSPASADQSKPKSKPKESMGNFQIQELMSRYNQAESKNKGAAKKKKTK